MYYRNWCPAKMSRVRSQIHDSRSVSAVRIPPENCKPATAHCDRLCVLDVIHPEVRDSSSVNVVRIPPENPKLATR
jgi:hypothetical protein